MRSFLIASVLLAAPASALAQPAKAADVQTMATDDCARARKAGKTCVLSIEGEAVEGGVPTAGESSLGAITFGDHASLIRIRRDFIPEIMKSAEDLD